MKDQCLNCHSELGEKDPPGLCKKCKTNDNLYCSECEGVKEDDWKDLCHACDVALRDEMETNNPFSDTPCHRVDIATYLKNCGVPKKVWMDIALDLPI